MMATHERQALAACLLLSAMLHALGAMLVQPRPLQIEAPRVNSQLTVLMPASARGRTESAPVPTPPESSELSDSRSAPIPVEVPKSITQAIDPLRFYPGSELDLRAEPVSEIEVYFPKLPPGSPAAAKVVLELRIDEAGLVVDAKVIEATHPGLFDAHAIDSFRKVNFLPAKLNGVPVKSVKRIEVGFEDLRPRGNSKAP